MITRRLFSASVNRNLFVFKSFQHQMAPVTRKQTASTNVKIVNKSIPDKKVDKKVSSKARLQEQQFRQQTGKDGLPMLPFPSQDDLEDWLNKNHNVVTGLWVKIAKKASGIPSLTYEEMLDAALCFGWIDGQRCGLDETWFLQRISPRRSKSNWSQINREKVKRLIRIGKMQPAGQRLIDEAKADGRWDNASKPTSGCVVPDELVAAVEESTTMVKEKFRTLNKESKLELINRVEEASSEYGRAQCIKSIVEMLALKETVDK